MNGPGHFLQAELLVEQATRGLERATIDTLGDAGRNFDRLVALARVHAELAKAAATLDAATRVPGKADDWRDVLDEGPAKPDAVWLV